MFLRIRIFIFAGTKKFQIGSVLTHVKLLQSERAVAEPRLAFATRRGVVIADPSHLSLTDNPPPVALEEITVDDKNVSAEEMASLSPGRLHFSFSFAGIYLAAPQRVQYRYMLEGLDHSWVDAGTRRVAYYTSIPHGHYRFLVSARNAGGAWGPARSM